MEFDEQDIFEFPVTLNASGSLCGAETDKDSALACFPEPRTGMRIHAPGLTRTTGDSAAMILGSHWTQASLKFRCTSTLNRYPSLN